MIFSIVRLYLTLSCQLRLSTALTLFFALYTQFCLSQLKGIRLWSGTLMGKQSCRTILFSKDCCSGSDVCSIHRICASIQMSPKALGLLLMAPAEAAFSALRPAVFQGSIIKLITKPAFSTSSQDKACTVRAVNELSSALTILEL